MSQAPDRKTNKRLYPENWQFSGLDGPTMIERMAAMYSGWLTGQLRAAVWAGMPWLLFGRRPRHILS